MNAVRQTQPIIDNAKIAADFASRVTPIHDEAVALERDIAAHIAAGKRLTTKKTNITKSVLAATTMLTLDFDKPGYAEALQGEFEKVGIKRTFREGDDQSASFLYLATHLTHATDTVAGPHGPIPKPIPNRTFDKYPSAVSHLRWLVTGPKKPAGPVTLEYIFALIDGHVNPITRATSMAGLCDSEKQRLSDTEQTVGEVVSKASVLADIEEAVTGREVVASMPLTDLSSSVPLASRFVQLVGIVDGDNIVIHVAPSQDLDLLSASIPTSDGTNAIAEVKQLAELLTLGQLVPDELSEIPIDPAAAHADPSKEKVPALRQIILENGTFTVTQARTNSPNLIIMATPLKDELHKPARPSFMNSGTRANADAELAPLGKRERFSEHKAGKTPAGIFTMEFEARKGAQGKTVAISWPPMTAFGQGRREMWAHQLSDAYKPTGSFVVEAAALEALLSEFTRPNLSKASGRIATVRISEEGLSMQVSTSPAILMAGVPTNSATMQVSAQTLVDALSAILALKPVGLTVSVDPQGLLEIAFSSDVNAYRVFIPCADRKGDVIITNSGGRLRRITRDDYAA